jgi:hypothetical protein
MARFIPVTDTNGNLRCVNFDWVSWVGQTPDGKTYIKLAEQSDGVTAIVTDASFETMRTLLEANH